MPGQDVPEGEELQLQDLKALLDVSKALSRESSLDKLLHLITGKVTEVLGADRSTLFLYDDSTHELWSRIAERLGETEIRFPIGVGIAGTVAETRRSANITDPYADPRFNPAFDKKTGFRSRSILCVPMIGFNGNLLGVIQVLNKGGGMHFGRRDESLLEAFASHAAVALERARLTEIAIQKERLDEALKMAREIQMSMIPTTFPPFPDRQAVGITATVKPAREVGGDFYDFAYLDPHHLYFCIGDVAGKGIPASLFMAVTKTLIKVRTQEDRSTASIMTHVNDALAHDNDSSMFVTLFVGILNVATGVLTYTSGGHNAPFLRRQDGSVARLDACRGPLVGAVPGLIYREEHLSIAPGDFIVLYTDGVTEAINSRGELFSEARLLEILRARGAATAERLVERTVNSVESFEEGTEQADDITMLVLEFIAAETCSRKFTICSRLSELSIVNTEVEAFGKQNRLPAAVLSRLRLIFDELISNVVRYACADGAEHDIEVHLEMAGQRLIATLVDDGPAFNPLEAPPPQTTASLREREPGGVGIHVVRHLVDEASYERRGRSNVLRLGIPLERQAPPAD